MYPALPYGVMVTVKNRFVNGTDEFNNDTYGFTTQKVGPCAIQQSSSREIRVANDQVTTGMIVFMPYGTRIGYLDAFIVNGTEYEVSAEPEIWVSQFSGHTSPVRVHGTLVKGAST